MIVELWSIKRVNPSHLLVPSDLPCECEYCNHDHSTQEKIYFDIHNILGRVMDKDIGKKVFFNTISKCFSVENDEQFLTRINKTKYDSI